VIRPVAPPLARRRDRVRLDLRRGSTVVVVSPHLDDAIWSLGATLGDVAARGVDVVNLTVFAGDPDSAELPSDWDRKAGFSSAGAAARRRREEDALACAALGVTPFWLSFPDLPYASDRSGVWACMKPVLARADLVLAPAFPLVHPDHVFVSGLISEHRDELGEVAGYVEQPYAEMEWFGARALPATDGNASLRWVPMQVSSRAWLRKQRAAFAYRSQLRAFARPSARLLARTALYELGRGGEYIGFPLGSTATQPEWMS
jgi:LmbE family N-acetylglucosaminyl deacetylase